MSGMWEDKHTAIRGDGVIMTQFVLSVEDPDGPGNPAWVLDKKPTQELTDAIEKKLKELAAQDRWDWDYMVSIVESTLDEFNYEYTDGHYVTQIAFQ